VRLLDGPRPFLTGWLPWAEIAAGANRTHNPPSIGQQVQILSESGDLRDGVIQGSVNSAANGRPSSKGDEHVLLAVGDARISVGDGGGVMVLRVGGSSVTITPSLIALNAARIEENG
jgi:phage baseplate assembly protein V